LEWTVRLHVHVLHVEGPFTDFTLIFDDRHREADLARGSVTLAMVRGRRRLSLPARVVIRRVVRQKMAVGQGDV
jgi:hypothetical protein